MCVFGGVETKDGGFGRVDWFDEGHRDYGVVGYARYCGEKEEWVGG